MKVVAALLGCRRFAVISTLVVIAGCQPRDKTFLTINICLGNASNVVPFKQQMQSIARNEGMTFIDGSDETNSELADLNAQDVAPQPFVNVGIDDNDGNIVMGGNLGLTNRQVSLGFREGADASKDRAFAYRAVSVLKRRWRVETVAPDKGSVPMKGC